MTKNGIGTRSFWIFAMVVGAVFLVLAANAARMLIVDEPRRSDVIVVLAGETDRRPSYALQLLRQGYAPRVLIDVPAEARIYDSNQLELARKYVKGLPEAASVGVCPIVGLSTWEESHDVEKCLAGESGRRILIVTSDFHTRRALSIFRHEMRGWSCSVAAARDPEQFGTHWWTHRQWAKTCMDEWLKSVWWNAVERWR